MVTDAIKLKINIFDSEDKSGGSGATRPWSFPSPRPKIMIVDVNNKPSSLQILCCASNRWIDKKLL